MINLMMKEPPPFITLSCPGNGAVILVDSTNFNIISRGELKYHISDSVGITIG